MFSIFDVKMKNIKYSACLSWNSLAAAVYPGLSLLAPLAVDIEAKKKYSGATDKIYSLLLYFEEHFIYEFSAEQVLLASDNILRTNTFLNI